MLLAGNVTYRIFLLTKRKNQQNLPWYKSALRGEPTQLSPDLLRRFSDQLSSRPATAQPRANSARPSSASLSGYAPSPDPIFKQPYPVALPTQSKSGLTYDYDAIKKECLQNGRLYQNLRVKLTQFCNTYEVTWMIITI